MDPAGRWLQERLGCTFADPGLLARALTHRSAGPDNNERLEYLGDAVLSFVIAEMLFHQFPGASEGELSRYRASLVSGEALAALAANGRYNHVPIDVVTSFKKIVNVDKHYNRERLRPPYKSFEMQPFLIMASE